MTRPADPPSPESLLAHREWMRAIARSLVGDENAVDDVEQRTWMTVLANRRPVESVRGWLRSVVRSSVVDEHRSASRRRAREEVAARPESLPPTDHLAAQAEAQRAVAAAVTGLPEPYRTTVLLRYFEELPLDGVASRMGVPLETVRTRLRRAHALLRDALDREFGDRRKWALVLLPLTKPRPLIPIGAATGGALLMAGKAKLVAVVVAVMALTAGVWWAADTATTPERGVAVIDTPPPAVAAPRVKATAPKADAPAETIGGLAVGVDVVDTAQRPVANARVTMSRVQRDPAVSSWESDWGQWAGRFALRESGPSATRAASTSADGAADVRGVTDGEWRLVVSAQGFADHDERVVVSGPPVRRRVVLLPGCELAGLVLGSSGPAAEGTEVWADTRRTVVDAGGRFRLAGLRAGVVDLAAGTARGALQQCGSVTLPDVREVTIRLAGGCAVRGRVVDDETGAPIEDARVLLRASRYDDLPRMLQWGAETTSAADGAFAWDDLPQGQPYLVWAFHDGYAACRDGRSALAPYAAFTPGGATAVELRMSRGGVVRGRVLRADGSPVEGAVVDVLTRLGLFGIEISENAVSAADGSFRVLAKRGHAMVRAQFEGARQRDFPKDPWSAIRADAIPAAIRVDVTAKEEAAIDVVVDAEPAAARTGVLSGVVRREDGLSVADALVETGDDLVRAVGPDGKFRFDGLAPRKYVVHASASGCAPARSGEVDVPADGAADGIEIVLPREETIAGRVVGPDGTAIAGAELMATPAASRDRDVPTSAMSAGDGSFIVHGLTSGEWNVAARAAGFARAEAKAGAGSKDVEIRMEKALSIVGVVVDAATGAPVEDVLVAATYSAYRQGFALYRSATTDAAGRFELTALAADTYKLWAGSEGNGATATDYVGRGVDGIHAGDRDVRIALDRGASIDGRVVDAAGHPVAGGTVGAFGPKAGATPGLRVRLVRVAHDGSFRLPGLAPGAYDVEATPFDGTGEQMTPSRVADVQAGTHDVVIESRPGVVIEGRFVNEDGTPFPAFGPANVELRTRWPNGSMKWSTGLASAWGADGTFRTQALDPAETYDIVVTQVPGRLGGAARGLRPGARGVDVVIRTGGRIEGRVLDTSGNPVPLGVGVSAIAKNGSGWPPDPGTNTSVTTGADGRFVLTGLADTTFRVWAGGEPSDFLSMTMSEPIAPGTRDVEFRLERGVSISGRVVDAKGAAMKGASVQATRQGLPNHVDADGKFTIRAQRPGTVRLFAQIGQRIVDLGDAQAPSDSLTFTIKDE